MKNPLIKINVDEKQQQVVSARELHEFLEIGTRYNDWFNRMTDYGFVENQDFVSITQKRVTAQGNETTYTDHAITIDMAKELSMIQRNEKGKLARQYFIAVEKQWNSPEAVMARALKMADNKLLEYQNSILQLEHKIEVNKPKVIFAEALETSNNSILIGELAKLLARNGVVDMGQNRLFKWLRSNGYLHKSGEQYNLPTQYSIDLGIIEVKTRTINNPDGSVKVTKTPKITGKGQIYFVNKLKEKIA